MSNKQSQSVLVDYLAKQRVDAKQSPARLEWIQFSMFGGTDMRRAAEIACTDRSLYTQPTRSPAPHGPLDTRLGISDRSTKCGTCGELLARCPGHWGVVELALPVFHVGFLKDTVTLLQCLCKSCAKLMVPKDKFGPLLARMRTPAMDALAKTRLRKRVVELCKKQTKCEWCERFNGPVRRLTTGPSIRITHDKYTHKYTPQIVADLHKDMYADAVAANPDLKMHFDRITEDLTPIAALNLFRRIPPEHAELMWFDSQLGRPEDMILTAMPVPPVPIRPSVMMDAGAGSNEDDLTVKLQECIQLNNSIRVAMEKGSTAAMLQDLWDGLQIQSAAFFNGELPGFPSAVRLKKPTRGLCQRLKGKQGRFRGNLSGKRVDFSGRTVISPDPNLPITEVGVPRLVAAILTFPERVTDLNKARLQQLVRNGPNWPGANYILTADGLTKNLRFGDRKLAAKSLRIGDVVERHMEDGDFVLFNRQPSLHKMSIMCHRARVLPWRTFRFNECVCAPYNADFDGDEMNLHLPQTEEARAEAAILMGVANNIITPRSGEPLVCATQDFITAAYLITQQWITFTRDEVCQVLAALGDAKETRELPTPAILAPYQLWTGKQVASILLQSALAGAPGPTLSLKARGYSGKRADGSEWNELCPKDSYVVIRGGELLSGNLDKKSLGGSKQGLIFVLVRDYGPEAASGFMLRLTQLCTRWHTNYGFSIGIEDVTPDTDLRARKTCMVEDGYTECSRNIRAYKTGTLTLQAGCNEEQSLEAVMNGVLGRLRESVGKMCSEQLPFQNAPRIMADCGSKGSTLNICQMVACVGQQSVGGSRIAEGFVNRTLPIFYPKAKDPAAKGFVANSFFSGLTATEFFFHTMGGREGLVDTAVKTAETGYMQRRMMKALEDLSITYDGTVRSSVGDVVQFAYGDDGLDPGFMEANARPVDMDRLMTTIRARTPDRLAPGLTPAQLISIGAAVVNSPDFQALLPAGARFLDEIRDFYSSCASTVQASHALVSEDDPNAAVLRRNSGHITMGHVKAFNTAALGKYVRAASQPGEAVGAVGAHSLGEPATQMTLKTFHFAGVASMNVTLGVPRIKEIMNASKTISTPIIEAALVASHSEVAARIVKARVEKTTLGEISLYIEEVYTPTDAKVRVKLDLRTIRALHLHVTARDVATAITRCSALKLKPDSVVPDGVDCLIITPPDTGFKLRGAAAARARELHSHEPHKLFFGLQHLKTLLPGVIIAGIPSVSRAVITQDDGRYKLLVEGYELLKVMGVPGVTASRTASNHIMEVAEVLGIEAARTQITSELRKTYSNYGIDIDVRHLSLLADCMSYRGEILGVTRFGIAKMKESVLMLASFEKTPDHLFDAAVHCRKDAVHGVSECIITGVPIPIGTGSFKMLQGHPVSAPQATPSPQDAAHRSAAAIAGKPMLVVPVHKPPEPIMLAEPDLVAASAVVPPAQGGRWRSSSASSIESRARSGSLLSDADMARARSGSISDNHGQAAAGGVPPLVPPAATAADEGSSGDSAPPPRARGARSTTRTKSAAAPAPAPAAASKPRRRAGARRAI